VNGQFREHLRPKAEKEFKRGNKAVDSFNPKDK
jgi:hypothetical protein